MLVSVLGFGHLVILKGCVVYLSVFRQMFVVCNSGYWYYYQMQPKSDMEFSCKQSNVFHCYSECVVVSKV